MPEREEASTLSRLSPGVSRRSFLGTTGAAAASLSVSGTAAASSCSRQDAGDIDQDVDLKKASTDEVELQTEAPESESEPDIEYDEVINVVEAGADNTGGKSISSVIQKLAGDDTLLKFPEGRYYVDELVRLTGFENFGMIGNNATLVPAPADEYKSEARMFKLGVRYNPGRNLEVKNFTVDYSAPNTGLRAFDMSVSDGLIAENITFEGVHDGGTWGPMHVDIVGSDGYGIVRNVEIPEGGVFTKNTSQDAMPTVEWGPTAFLLSPYHSGHIELVDCVIGAFPDNGVYDSNSPGQVVVKGGRFQNCKSGNIRITGDNSGVYGAHIVIDQNRPLDDGQHGIRLDGGSNITISDCLIEMPQPNGHAIFAREPVESAVIKNTEIVTEDNDARDSVDSLAIRKGAGEILVEGCSITHNHPGQALQISEGDIPVIVKDLTLKGEATGESGGRNAIYCERDGCEFHDLDVDLPAGDHRRALGIFSDNVLVKGGEYASSGRPLTIEGSDVSVREITAGAYNGDVAVKVVEGAAELINNTLYQGISGSNVATSGNQYK
ncbi:right-handed parallel beta-helix repeat-containing protein [Halocatena pleomorpha]|uniref:Right-handed parallel beta-helix repeat-containing protein n=1 Tax=Halocatena pleomorpha TaxID=1785090 RepID=A0A3P3RAQ5_9EURY|nr:right-handed parallel beta-helix repeat-containing protein [Halocatena pleomorpha]RRJ30561.1 right-handed parallel beta-helix repeat-containing protein [Halocatena pleomorpha]